MGRSGPPRIYTDEERLERRRAAARRWYHRNKGAVLAKLKLRTPPDEETLKKWRKYSADRRKAFPEQCRRINKASRDRAKKDEERYKTLMVARAKSRARMRGLEFNITKEDVTIPELCPLLGIPLETEGHRNTSPSIDRIDSSRGYTKDNICVMSWRANSLKGDATKEELETLLANWDKAFGRK